MGRRLLITGIAVVVTVAVGVAVWNSTGAADAIRLAAPLPAEAEVAALVDGDTFDVRSNDQITRVRLGFVATPPGAAPGHPSSCLAPEASARLAAVIPVRTRVRLTYGKDRFGRTTAMVGTTDGRGVNAEIVRAGMAPLIPADAQTPAPPDLGAAAQEALVNKRGMHSPDIGCTVPGQVKALSEQVAKIPATPAPDMTTVDLSNSANSATDARMAAEELDSEFAQTRQDAVWIILDPAERAQLRAQVQSARDQAAARETVLRTATNIAVNQDTTRTSTQREAAHIARVLASIRRAEQARAAEAARRVAAARRAQAEMAQARADAAQSKRDKQQQDSSSSGSDPTSSDSTGSDSAGGSSSSGKRSSGRSGSGRSGQSSSG